MVEYEDRGRGTRARERDAIMRSTNLDSDLVILHAEGFRTFLEGSVEVEAPVLLSACKRGENKDGTSYSQNCYRGRRQ